MDKTVKRVLEIIEEAGFEAYIVGGYVRDFILKIKSTDVDICTNATPKDLQIIFKDYSTKSDDYGSFKIVSDKYNFDITTYRKEYKYENRKPIEIEYVNNLLVDLNRRDITINAICMNSNGLIIDLLNGIADLENKVIRVIGEPEMKFIQDPLRILRVVRFASLLGFTIENSVEEAIIRNSDLVRTLSNTRKKEELEKILLAKNSLSALKLLKMFGLDEAMGIKYDNVVYTDDLCGMYAQLDVDSFYSFTKEERRSIGIIKEIVLYGKIDRDILFNYGLYFSTVAGEIMGLSRKDITAMYEEMPLTSMSEIEVDANDIMKALELAPSKMIKIVQDKLKDLILAGTLVNERQEIISYLQNNKGGFSHAENNN